MAAPLPGSPLFTPGNTLKEEFCTLRLCAGATLALLWPRSAAGVHPTGSATAPPSVRFVSFFERSGEEVRMQLPLR